MVGVIGMKFRRSASVGYFVNYICGLDIWPRPWPWPWISQGQIWNSCVSEIVSLLDVKQKGRKPVGYCPDYVTLHFNHTYNLGTVSSRSKFELVVLSQEWEVRLTWNKKDVYWLFMTMGDHGRVVDVCYSDPLQWRHNGHDGVWNHQPHDCFLIYRLFRYRSKKTSELRVTGLCEGNSPVTGEFPTQRASNAENVSIW